MQFQNVYSFLIGKLEKELPKHLLYHNVEHTKEVLTAAEHLAKTEHISDHELVILKTAALFHDAGFLYAYTGHEEASVKLAKEILPQYNYSAKDIEEISRLIEATRLPQTPHNRLAEILCDADLYYLGTNDFIARAENLFNERQKQHKVQSREQWLQQQQDFIGSHSYFTVSASHQLNQKKYENLSQLKQRALLLHPAEKHKVKSHLFHDVVFVGLGVISAAFGLEGFLVPNLFFDGGATGIALLIHKLSGLRLSYVIAIVNLPFIIMGYYVVNFKYALKTSLCILLLALCLFIPFPTVTSDKLLVSFFGGFFLGIGSGLVMRAGCAIDGTEILALYTWRRTSFTISEIIMAINIIIFGTVAIMLSMEAALYSLLTYITASKTIDYVVEGLEAYQGVTIISGKSEIIKDRLVNTLGRGITIYKGERGYLPGNYHVHEDCDIIFTVITRLELRKLTNLVAEIDPKAFVIANPIKDASGGIIKKRLNH